jgi:hypothetical protein
VIDGDDAALVAVADVAEGASGLEEKRGCE